MSTANPANLDSVKLKNVTAGGLIRESVEQKIWDISKIPLAFTDLVGTGTHDNEYHEWTTDKLADPDTANAKIDGQDVTDDNSKLGKRLGNHSQISTKRVSVSFRADASNVIGRAKELGYQMGRRMQELKRDVNAICLLPQTAVADTGAAAGKIGGLPSFLATNYAGGTGGAAGGFNFTTKIATAPTVSTAANALTETKLRAALQAVYMAGGEASVLLAHPGIITAFSQFMIKSKGATAVIQTEQPETSPATALGAVNVFLTDFGTLKAVPERLAPTRTVATKTCADAFILSPDTLKISYLKPYQTDDLAKTGLSTTKMMSVDYTLVVGSEEANAIIADIDVTAEMTAS